MKLSYRELERRLARAMEVNSLAQKELQRWCDGFVDVCALLMEAKKDHIFFKALPKSTLKLVEKKYETLIETETNPDSNIGNNSGSIPDNKAT